jgi:hypothetical protein
MSQEYRVVPAALLESALKTLAGVAPGRFAVETELRAIVDAPVPPAGREVEVLGYVVADSMFFLELLQAEEMSRNGKYKIVEVVDRAHVTRLQAENAALQQRLTVADQRVDDLQHQKSESLEVNPHSLRVVLTALVGAPHEIRELQACRGIPDNAIDQLLREYNAWIEMPTSATPQ